MPALLPACRACAIMGRANQLGLTESPIYIHKGEQRSAASKQRNPLAKLPVLEVTEQDGSTWTCVLLPTAMKQC